ncbi:MAG: UDP-N-acetylmuramoyl-L-alanyl-D-glutamate--2,6-diaminopimelate ligase [Bacteroidales bacterium]|nr:UDP-N-acetylmuramoyl-L-alanyl-D-glutamate--2,6-diaminopimelate ligase [Bacteroidales bacterium]
MKKLSEILNGCKILRITGNTDIQISGVSFDSRHIEKDYLFVAVSGTSTDGHEFINSAISKGASAILCESMPAGLQKEPVYIQTDSSSKSLGILISNFYDNPSASLKLVGVTGTNGKTTTATLLYRLFRKNGYKAGLLSTIRNYVNDTVFEATHTTPDALQINQLLRKMVDDGCEYAFMEVSSHAVAQNRIAGLRFTGAVFTNITHDHLDYHQTFDEYLKAKKKFFDELDKDAFVLVNIDDRNGKVMAQNTKAKVSTYGIRSLADYKARIIESHFEGMLLHIEKTDVWVKLLGEFSAYNLLAVYATSRLLGLGKEEILKTISVLDTVDGRFEYLRSNNGVIAIIDYAHTPDALLNVLNTLNQIRTGNEQLITVVGAGGNRDKTKRPKMARVCAQKSNTVILTSDNPRFEKPEDIIIDMEAGIKEEYKNKYLVIVNRREAIKTACMMASGGDIVLIAGKGHETYQEIKGVKHHFSDKEIVAEQFMLNKTNPQ